MNDEMTWLGITKNDLIEGISNRQERSKESVQQVAMEVLFLNKNLKEHFKNYWITGFVNHEIEYHGYSFKYLVKERDMHPIAAFLALDWLIKEPERATSSLKRGYDTIIIEND